MKKRRFAEGGFSDIDEGRDTPDQALARKASMSSLASSDKAAGLASTKGQDVGLKRFFMGDIDKPGSEASNSFGAGKGSSDRMAQAADQNLPVRPPSPVRPNPRPPPFNIPSTPIDVAESPMISGTPTGPNGYKRDTAREDALTLDRESRRTTPTARPTARPTVRPNISASDKPMPPVGPMGSTKRVAPGEIPGQADDVKAPASTGQDTSGPSNLGRIASAVGAGAGVLGTAAALRTAGHADRYAKTAAKTAKTFKDATDANNAKKAAIATKRAAKAKAEAAAKTGGPKEKNPFSAAKDKAPRGRSSFKSADDLEPEFKRGGKAKAYASGGSVSSRGDGIAQRGKTRGMMR